MIVLLSGSLLGSWLHIASGSSRSRLCSEITSGALADHCVFRVDLVTGGCDFVDLHYQRITWLGRSFINVLYRASDSQRSLKATIQAPILSIQKLHQEKEARKCQEAGFQSMFRFCF